MKDYLSFVLKHIEIISYASFPALGYFILLLSLANFLTRSYVNFEEYINNIFSSRFRRVFVNKGSMRIVLFSSFFGINFFSVISAICFFRSIKTSVVLGTSCFLIMNDPLIFSFVLEVHFRFLNAADHVNWLNERDGLVDNFLKLGISVCLKHFALCIGATSGHVFVEEICRVSFLELCVYTLLLISLPLPVTLWAMYHGNTSALNNEFEQSRANFRGLRARSRSCSIEQPKHTERLPVDFESFKRNLKHKPVSSKFHRRVIYFTSACLIILYVHNYHLLHNSSPLSTSLYNASNVGSWSAYLFGTGFFTHFSYIHLNLIFLLLTGFLLYHRAHLYALDRRDLLYFNLKSEEKSVYLEDINLCLPTRPLGINEPASQFPVDEDDDKVEEAINVNHVPLVTKTGVASERSSLSVDDSVAFCVNQLKQGLGHQLNDEQILRLISLGHLKTRELEPLLNNHYRSVRLRRMDLGKLLANSHLLDRLPYKNYDYRLVQGQCCEEVIGYIPIPIGKVGPLLVDGRSHYLPLATTEGCLVASTNRGCRALFLSGGVTSVVFRDQMTRAPVVWFPSVIRVVHCIAWIESVAGFQSLKTAFDQTSSHIDLLSVYPNPSGRYLHIRFAARTGDAMGMNMTSKAASSALHELQRHFPDMRVISLSGNMCTDKKPAMINAILGRGKSVLAEACLSATVLAKVLHTTAPRMARLALAKNWTGSAMAGCPGMFGSNAHAANLVAGIFAATGQDLAQVVDSSACLTQFEVGDDDSLLASVTMPCVEVGTVGGGTRLPAQRACLDLIDLCVDRPTEHLARLVASVVLAGELSLMAALDTDDLVSAHMRLNRAAVPSGTTNNNNNHTCTTNSVACVDNEFVNVELVSESAETLHRIPPGFGVKPNRSYINHPIM